MRFVEGEYEPGLVEQFFQEVVELLRGCPAPPYLLVDYTNLQIAAEMTQVYADQVRAYRHLAAGVFRYNLGADTEGVLTKVAVLVANRTDANIFPDERSARQAIQKARQAADQARA